MTAHDHPRLVPGCFRCELNRDELGIAPESVPEVRDEWRDTAWEAYADALNGNTSRYAMTAALAAVVPLIEAEAIAPYEGEGRKSAEWHRVAQEYERRIAAIHAELTQWARFDRLHPDAKQIIHDVRVADRAAARAVATGDEGGQ